MNLLSHQVIPPAFAGLFHDSFKPYADNRRKIATPMPPRGVKRTKNPCPNVPAAWQRITDKIAREPLNK